MAKHRGIEFAATISSFRPPFLGIDVSSVKAFVLEQREKKIEATKKQVCLMLCLEW